MFLISIFFSLILLSYFNNFKWEGLVGLFLEIPKIFAPNIVIHSVNQEPLNPVWPVIIIFLFLNIFSNFIFTNFYFKTKSHIIFLIFLTKILYKDKKTQIGLFNEIKKKLKIFFDNDLLLMVNNSCIFKLIIEKLRIFLSIFFRL